MLVVDGKRIVRMTAEGIAYIDEDTFEHVIYFSDCYANEVQRRLDAVPLEKEKYKEHNNLDWDDYIERIKNMRTVATRNIIDLYIEFYTVPRTCFRFETREEWFKVRKHIDDCGWRTSDLT